MELRGVCKIENRKRNHQDAKIAKDAKKNQSNLVFLVFLVSWWFPFC